VPDSDQTTGTSEPDWSAATVPGVDTVSDKNVTWTLIGFVREYNRISKIDGDGRTTISVANTEIPTPLTDAQAASGTTKFTGICTANRNVTYPAPAPTETHISARSAT
jgi:hypothetical protein